MLDEAVLGGWQPGPGLRRQIWGPGDAAAGGRPAPRVQAAPEETPGPVRWGGAAGGGLGRAICRSGIVCSFIHSPVHSGARWALAVVWPRFWKAGRLSSGKLWGMLQGETAANPEPGSGGGVTSPGGGASSQEEDDLGLGRRDWPWPLWWAWPRDTGEACGGAGPGAHWPAGGQASGISSLP